MVDLSKRPKVLAVSSGGGHWKQLCRMAVAFERYQVSFACVSDMHRSEVGAARYYAVPDASRSCPWRFVTLTIRIYRILMAERPDVIASTGAAPGCVAIILGRILGARTIWLDSWANAERISLSGRLAGRFAHLWLTQWPHLARARGPQYFGSVL